MKTTVFFRMIVLVVMTITGVRRLISELFIVC